MNWIGGAVQGLGSILGGAFNLISQNQQNKANMQLAEYQYSKNLEQWNRENAYNHPAAQMQRLKEAGLNPNLMYGNTAAGGTAASSPQYDAPTIKKYQGFAQDFANVGAGIQNAIQQHYDSEIKRQQAKVLQQQVVNSQVDEMLKIEEYKRRHRENFVGDSTLNTVIDQVKWNLEKTIREANNISVDRGRIAAIAQYYSNQNDLFPVLKQKHQKEVDKLAEEIDKIRAEYREINSRTSLNYANIGLVKANTNLANDKHQLAGFDIQHREAILQTYENILKKKEAGLEFDNDVKELQAIIANMYKDSDAYMLLKHIYGILGIPLKELAPALGPAANMAIGL